MPFTAPISRRRALAAGAAAGLAATVSRLTTPAWSAPTRGFTLLVPAFRGRTAALRAPRRFDLLGVRGALPAGLEVRARRRGGGWSRWVALHDGADHGPDTGTGEHASDPVWTGSCHELQLRGRSDTPLEVHFVAVSRSSRRRAARARAAQAPGAPAIVPRAAWGADQVPPREDPSYGEVQMAFVHHTVNANDYAPEESAGMVLAIAKYHRNTNGWNDIGYNFLVDRYGQVFEGRAGGVDLPVIGAQAQGYNRFSTGVAVLGTHTDAGVTPEAFEAVARVIAWKLPLHGVPVEGEVTVVSGGGSANRHPYGSAVTFQRISGHRDGDSTTCPGDALYAQLPALRARAAQLAPEIVAASVRLTLARVHTGAVRYGDAFAVSGRIVRPDGTAVAAQAVQIQKQGARAWNTVARATTDAAGAFTAMVPWRKAGTIRARAAVPGAAVVTSPPLAVGLAPALTARAATYRVRAGSSVLVSGSVRPATALTILLERQEGERWRGAGRLVRKPRSGPFARRVPLRRPGLYRITVRAGAGAEAARVQLFVRAVRNGKSLRPATTGGAPA